MSAIRALAVRARLLRPRVLLVDGEWTSDPRVAFLSGLTEGCVKGYEEGYRRALDERRLESGR